MFVLSSRLHSVGCLCYYTASGGTRSRREASMNALVKHQPETAIETRQPSLAVLMDRFIEAQDVSESSRSTYRRELRQFVKWLEQTGRSKRMDQLTRQDILAYKQDLFSSGRSSYTVSGYLVAVRRLYEWLEAEKVYPNIAKDVKGAKKAKGFRRDGLTPSQIREALDSIDETTPEGLRDFALLNLLARTGLRTRLLYTSPSPRDS